MFHFGLALYMKNVRYEQKKLNKTKKQKQTQPFFTREFQLGLFALSIYQGPMKSTDHYTDSHSLMKGGGDANQNLYLKHAHPIASYLLSETFLKIQTNHTQSLNKSHKQIRLLINQPFMKEYSPPYILRKQETSQPVCMKST